MIKFKDVVLYPLFLFPQIWREPQGQMKTNYRKIVPEYLFLEFVCRYCLLIDCPISL